MLTQESREHMFFLSCYTLAGASEELSTFSESQFPPLLNGTIILSLDCYSPGKLYVFHNEIEVEPLDF